MTQPHEKIPAACHTYSKGDDQFPANMPARLARGDGYRVWDESGRAFIDWTMGLASVSLGHAYKPVVAAAAAWLTRGVNLPRPTVLEEELADHLLALSPCAEMVKFGKHGSDGTTAAVRLARAYTGRNHILACDCNPFYSVHDWWIGTTASNAGVPAQVSALTHTFPYGDIAALDQLISRYGEGTAAIFIEPAATVPVTWQNTCRRCAGEAALVDACPIEGFWGQVAARAKRIGALLILDENKTGFRMALPGAETFYDLAPDIVCYGKAIANGFSVSAIAGRADILDQGGIYQTERERVFLLSATHGGETHALAAAIKTVEIMRNEPVLDHIWRIGGQLRDGFNELSGRLGLGQNISMAGYGCFPSLVVAAPDGDDMLLRSLFLQEMASRGVIFNFAAPSYAHDAEAVGTTLEAAEEALAECGEALAYGTVRARLDGPELRPVFRRRN